MRALHLSSTAINSWSHSIVPSHPNVQLFRSHYTPKYVVAAVRVCLTLKARFGSTIRTNRLSEPCDIWFFSVARLSNSACVFDYFVFDISIKPLQLRSPPLRFRFFFFQHKRKTRTFSILLFFDISVKGGRFRFFFFRHKREDGRRENATVAAGFRCASAENESAGTKKRNQIGSRLNAAKRIRRARPERSACPRWMQRGRERLKPDGIMTLFGAAVRCRGRGGYNYSEMLFDRATLLESEGSIRGN